MKSKLLSILLMTVLVFGILSGCGSGTAKDENTTSPTTQQTASTEATNEGIPGNENTGGVVLPLVKEKITLTFWTPMDPSVAGVSTNYNDVLFIKELEKLTNIHIDFKHPQSGEAFNLMIASGDLPDIISIDWSGYPGGITKVATDGLAINFKDKMAQLAPNLQKVLTDSPDAMKQVLMDDGGSYIFPLLRVDPYGRTYIGPQYRKDWLDKLGLKVPTTIDELYNVLIAFRDMDPNGNQKADEIPTTSPGWWFFSAANFPCGAWGAGFDFSHIDGKVKFGPIEQGYYEGIKTLNKWYKEKLLDNDFLTQDDATFNNKILGGQVGTWLGYTGGTLGGFVRAFQEKDPNAKLCGGPYLSLNAGETPAMGQQSPIFANYGAIITSKNKYVDESIKWLDFQYSKMGYKLSSLGVEGTTYNLVDGKPVFTDEIFKNPRGLSVDNALGMNTFALVPWPHVYSKEAYENYLLLPEQKEAIPLWSACSNVNQLPTLSLTTEESNSSATIMTDINTYVQEMFGKFVMGMEPLENFNNYVDNIKKMKIDEAIAIKQAALDRYNARK